LELYRLTTDLSTNRQPLCKLKKQIKKCAQGENLSAKGRYTNEKQGVIGVGMFFYYTTTSKVSQ
jgi:hypothetical protein